MLDSGDNFRTPQKKNDGPFSTSFEIAPILIFPLHKRTTLTISSPVNRDDKSSRKAAELNPNQDRNILLPF